MRTAEDWMNDMATGVENPRPFEPDAPTPSEGEVHAVAKVIEQTMIEHDRPASYWDCECAARAVLSHLRAQRKESDGEGGPNG